MHCSLLYFVPVLLMQQTATNAETITCVNLLNAPLSVRRVTKTNVTGEGNACCTISSYVYYDGASWVSYAPYDNATQVCCQGADTRTKHFYGFTSTVAFANACCLGQPYNRTEKFRCCGGTFFNHAAKDYFTRSAVGGGDACCGPYAYSTGVEKCCEDWSRGEACCGMGYSNHAYNTSTDICCGNIYSGKGNACCVINGYFHSYDSRKNCCKSDGIVDGITCTASASTNATLTLTIYYTVAYFILKYS